jgi:CRISPR-associated protein Csm5
MNVKPFLKRYRLELTTLAPVHIGSGEIIKSKEWLFVPRNNTLQIPDMAKLYQVLSDRGKAEEFERFLLIGKDDLRTWLNNTVNLPLPSPDIDMLGGYVLAVPELEQAKPSRRQGYDRNHYRDSKPPETQLNDLHAFIKDACGKPYIPGSSIKGMLLNLMEKQYLQHAGRSTASSASELLDVLKPLKPLHAALRVPDSTSYKLSVLTVCQKIDAFVDNRDKYWGLPLFRECLRPNLKFTLDLTIDGTKLGEIKHTLVEGLLAKIRGECYLGAGCGFLSKTIWDIIEEPQRSKGIQWELSRRFRQHNHGNDIAYHGKSPRCVKLTKYNGKLYEMGKCRIDIKRISDEEPT